MENETTLYIKLIHVNVRNAQTTLWYIKSQYKTTKPYAQTTFIIIIIIFWLRNDISLKNLKKNIFQTSLRYRRMESELITTEKSKILKTNKTWLRSELREFALHLTKQKQ